MEKCQILVYFCCVPSRDKKMSGPKKTLTYSKFEHKIDEINSSPPEIMDEEVWAIIHSYIEQNGLNSAQIHSFNDFIHNGIQNILDIQNIKHIHIEHEDKSIDIDLGDYILNSPKYTELNGDVHPLFPMEALWRNTTYASSIYIDVTVTPKSGKSSFYEKVYFGDIPVMVRSDLCNTLPVCNDKEIMGKHSEDMLDHGGYFVIASKNESSSGGCAQRRVLVAQERITNNQIFIFKNRKHIPKYSIYTECHSTVTGTHMTTTTVGKIQNRITCLLPWIEGSEIPVGVLFRAFGVKNEKEMTIMILGPSYSEDKEALEMINSILEYSYECSTQEAALHFIGRRGRKFLKDTDIIKSDDEEEQEETVEEEKERNQKQTKDREAAISYAKHLVNTEVFSHIGQGEEYANEKAIFLGYMIKKLIYVIMNRRNPENRDHYANKRIHTTGTLLKQQFYAAIRRLITELTNSTLKAMKQGHNVNITSWIKSSIITNAMSSAISANAWSSSGSKSKGIAQIFEQYNYTAGLANMRKVTLPIDGEGGKITEPRDLQGSQFGLMCPAETPEGKKVGLVRNMALLCYITIGSDPLPVMKIVKSLVGPSYKDKYPESLDWTRVFVNGVPMGSVKDPKKLRNELIKMRRSSSINPETSIAYYSWEKEIHISTESGRPCRPLLVVKDGEIVLKLDTIKSLLVHELTWSELLAKGFVDLIDKAEEEDATVIGYPSDLEKLSNEARQKITHCELHPSMMYGVGGSIIPFPDHNQSPRNTYQAAMGKQAVGLPFTNPKQMMTGSFSTMRYLQIPMALSRAAVMVGFDELPSGQNAMTMITPRPFNEEDSMEINGDSIGRDFMVTDKWVCYRAERRKEKAEIFGVPTEEKCERFRGNPGKLNEQGFVPKGTVVNQGDILIGKMIEHKHDAASTGSGIVKKKYTDVSVKYDHIHPAVVDSIQIGRSGDGYEYISVMTVQQRKPIIGDKFAYRHGQKGTIGKIVRAIDLPFNLQGVAPDILLNALAFPSRMTIAMLIELWTGKAVSSTSPLHDVLVAEMVINNNSELVDTEDSDIEFESERNSEFSNMYANPKYKHLVDATPFRKFSRSVIKGEMSKYGMELGDEYFIDGITGKPTRCFAFFGPCYIQRLKHMVIDKVHARSRGPRATLTRQPKEGRNIGGGLRYGTMERDCILGQGGARITKDRLMEQSDPFQAWYCNICGLPAHVENEGKIRECRVCSTTDVSRVKIPYGTKLINQELMAINIVPRVLTSPHSEINVDDKIDDK